MAFVLYFPDGAESGRLEPQDHDDPPSYTYQSYSPYDSNHGSYQAQDGRKPFSSSSVMEASTPSSSSSSSSSSSLLPIRNINSPSHYSSYSYSYSPPSSYSSSIRNIHPGYNKSSPESYPQYRQYQESLLTPTNTNSSNHHINSSFNSTSFRAESRPESRLESRSRAPHFPMPQHQFSQVLDSSGIFPNSRLSYSQISKHFQHDDETIAGRKIFKNPRNVPSEQCPRDEQAARRMVRKPGICLLGFGVYVGE